VPELRITFSTQVSLSIILAFGTQTLTREIGTWATGIINKAKDERIRGIDSGAKSTDRKTYINNIFSSLPIVLIVHFFLAKIMPEFSEIIA
jgi:hypothetical protein